MTVETLGQHVQFIRGVTFKPTDKCAVGTKDSLVCLRTANVQQSLDESDLIAIPASIVKNPDKIVRIGDILVSSANSWNLVGKCCRVESLQYPSTAGGFISILRADPCRLDAAYLYRWFASDRIQATVRSFGNQTTNISNLDHSRTLSLPIPIPPLPEQKRIAAILDAADALRAKRRESIEQLDSLVQVTFLEMFGDPVENPKGWAVKPLNDMAVAIMSGNTPKGGEEVYVKEGITFFRSQNVWKNRIELDDIAYIDSDTHRRMKKSSLRNKDILMTKTGRINTEHSSLGRAALFLGPDDSANINGHVYLIRLRKGCVHEFVLRILTTRAYRDYIRGVCVGGIDKRQINKSHIESFPIISPPSELQTRFASIVESIERQKARLKAHLAELDTLFASLQSRAFNGELMA